MSTRGEAMRGNAGISRKSSPQVSIVIPVYNTGVLLRRCLDSLAAQTLREIELICVDDGSTDDSLLILQEYANRDPRFHMIAQENQGPGPARNAGLEKAEGKYVIFLDSDDWFEPDLLEHLFRTAEETSADVTLCCSDEFDTHSGEFLNGAWMLKKELLPGRTFAPSQIAGSLFQFTYGWPWDKLYRADFVSEKGLLFPSLRNSEDLVFVFKSLALASAISVSDHLSIHHRVNRLTSVSNMREQEPTAPFQAARLLYEDLKESRFLSLCKDSLLRWEVSFFFWHVSSLKDRKKKKELYFYLKKEWVPLWKREGLCASLRGDARTMVKFRLLSCFPYPLFAAATAAHRLLKRLKKPQ